MRRDGRGLTKCEGWVYDLAREGLTNQEIADRLFVTKKTVKWHLTRIYKRLEKPPRPGRWDERGGDPTRT